MARQNLKKSIDWFATILLITAGVLISAKLPYFEYSYILFFIGHLIYVVLFSIEKRYSLILANLFFMTIDLIGVYNWIL